MKISRLKVAVWGLATFVAGTMAVNAQSAGNVDLNFTLGTNSTFLDVFGVPEAVNPPESAVVTITDQVVYVDGGGKISGYVLLSVDAGTGAHSDLVGNVTGAMGNKGTDSQVKISYTGKGATTEGDLVGAGTLKFSFTGQAVTTPETVTNIITAVTNCTSTTNCVMEPLTNCAPVTGTNLVVVTNSSQITAGATVLTNSARVLTNWFETNIVVSVSADNSNIVTTPSAVINSQGRLFLETRGTNNLCASNAVPVCQNYVNITNVAIANTNGLGSNDVVVTSGTSLAFTNVTSFITASFGPTGNTTITNTSPFTNATGGVEFLFLASAQTNTICTAISNTVVSTSTVVTTTNAFAAITSTAALTNVAGSSIFTNTTPFAAGVFLVTNTVSIRTNTDLPIVVATFTTNSFSFSNEAGVVVSPFRLTVTSGTNTFTATNDVPTLTNVCTVVEDCVPGFTTNTVTIPASTDIAGTFNSFSYASGIKGEKTVSIKNLAGTISPDNFVANSDAPVAENIIFLQKNANSGVTLNSRATIAIDGDPSRTTLPFTGNGNVNSKNSKFTLNLKGVAEAKGSSISLKGTATGNAGDGSLSIDGAAATGKILGQKIKSNVTQ